MGWRLFGRRRRSASQIIDLRDRTLGAAPGPAAAPSPLPVLSAQRYAQLVARRQAELAQAEALRQVEALRTRHWSPERIFEESRLGIDWWEHPLADPHAMLGILPGDSLDDATIARRRIAMSVHPDRVGASDDASTADTSLDRGAERQMAAVNVAYDRLRQALGPIPAGASPAPGAGGAGPKPLRSA